MGPQSWYLFDRSRLPIYDWLGAPTFTPILPTCIYLLSVFPTCFLVYTLILLFRIFPQCPWPQVPPLLASGALSVLCTSSVVIKSQFLLSQRIPLISLFQKSVSSVSFLDHWSSSVSLLVITLCLVDCTFMISGFLLVLIICWYSLLCTPAGTGLPIWVNVFNSLYISLVQILFFLFSHPCEKGLPNLIIVLSSCHFSMLVYCPWLAVGILFSASLWRKRLPTLIIVFSTRLFYILMFPTFYVAPKSGFCLPVP
jgi:hypothetical protein